MGHPRPHITVVGLGPAGAAYVTNEVRALMASARQTFLRTGRHPAIENIGSFIALDDLYETADTFEEVYADMVEELVASAILHAPQPVVYAVPGSPSVAERTVELLRNDPRVEVTIVPGLSFLDLAWDRLGIDPLRAGVRLVDAGQFSLGSISDRGPYLVAQCWTRELLSEIKLSPSYDEDRPVPEVVLLHHLGLEDEQVVRVGWWDLDRTLEPDHLTSLYIPKISAPAELEREMVRLEDLMATLRARCPWDQAQTHGSLMPHLLEETYEVLDALREFENAESHVESAEVVEVAAAHLQEELGDLLFQIVFHARLAQEIGRFSLADVARGVHDKLVHRHPHVFADVDVDSAQQVIANWEEIKKAEKGRSSVTEGIPADLPALLLSTKLQRKALSVGVSDRGSHESGKDLPERIALLASREFDPIAGAAQATLAGGDETTEQLVGQALFEMANLSRRLGVDPEQALRSRALAFRDTVLAREGEARGLPIHDASTH